MFSPNRGNELVVQSVIKLRGGDVETSESSDYIVEVRKNGVIFCVCRGRSLGWIAMAVILSSGGRRRRGAWWDGMVMRNGCLEDGGRIVPDEFALG